MAALTKKVPVSFNVKLLETIDLRWKKLGFNGRSDYINNLIRADLEKGGQEVGQIQRADRQTDSAPLGDS